MRTQRLPMTVTRSRSQLTVRDSRRGQLERAYAPNVAAIDSLAGTRVSDSYMELSTTPAAYMKDTTKNGPCFI